VPTKRKGRINRNENKDKGQPTTTTITRGVNWG